MECALMALVFVQVSASPCSAQFLRSHQQRYLDKHCTMGKSTLHWPTHVVASQIILQSVRAASFTLPHWSSHLQQLSEQIKSDCPASACEGQNTRRQRQQALHTHTHTDLDFLAVLVLAVAAGGMSHLPMDCCAAGGGGGGGAP
jgi:hypothetical protein